jgi:hypothetical protein
VLAGDLQRDRSTVGTANRADQVVRVIDLDLVSHHDHVATSKSGLSRDRSLDDVGYEYALRLYTEDVTEIAVECGEFGAGEGIDSAPEPESRDEK